MRTCPQIADKQAIADINLILTNRYFKLGGFPIHSSLDFPDRNVFVKTGTSRNFRDNWSVGYTDHYIIGVWAGNKSGANMKGVSGATGAGEIFSRIVYALEPNSVEQKTVSLPIVTKPYLEITAPLERSVFSIDPTKAPETQKIKLNFRTNQDYDAVSWLLDGKKIDTDLIMPTAGIHTLTLALLQDGTIKSSAQVHFEIKNDE